MIEDLKTESVSQGAPKVVEVLVGREEGQGQAQLAGDVRVGAGMRLQFEGTRLLGYGRGGVAPTFTSIARDIPRDIGS